ncbi:MAG TPA: hypothetical protein HPP90_05860 [Deltaproteobacteria bacterium]|nr:hypothetical protein [Deltaproteobacteria bacterium]
MAIAKFKKKYFLKLLSSPLTLFPFLAGVTDLAVLWAFSIPSGIGIFAGIACVLGAAGYFLTNLFTGNRSLAENVLESLQREAMAEREKALDELDARLSADGDPRTEACLRDLRTMAKAFEEGKSWSGVLNSPATIDILSGVDQLFKQCVFSLENTLDLSYTASRMTTVAARDPILARREGIIEEVAESIHKLGNVLASIQLMGLDEASRESDLAGIRKELDQNLEVAGKVKQRMMALENEVRSHDVAVNDIREE